MSEQEVARGPGRPAKGVTLVNKSKGLRRVAGIKIMPDDKGVEISREQFEQLKGQKAFAAQLAAGEFEVR